MPRTFKCGLCVNDSVCVRVCVHVCVCVCARVCACVCVCAYTFLSPNLCRCLNLLYPIPLQPLRRHCTRAWRVTLQSLRLLLRIVTASSLPKSTGICSRYRGKRHVVLSD